MYSGDLSFSIRAAELIYSHSMLTDGEFVNWCAGYYYSNRYNILSNELLESTYSAFNVSQSFVNVEGGVFKCGANFKKDVLMFSPGSNDVDGMTSLKQKIFRKNCYDEDTPNMVHENEFVLLVEHGQEAEEVASEKIEEESLGTEPKPEEAEVVNKNLSNLKEDKELLALMVLDGKNIRSIRVAYINEISKEFKLKLFTLGQTDAAGNDVPYPKESSWTIVRPELSNNKLIIKQMECLQEFCTKVTMNPAIQQIILSTPLCHPIYLTKLSKSSSLIMNNPTTKNRLGIIIDQLVEKLNPAQLKSVRNSLASNMTFIQTPSGTNKILTTVEIVRAWLKYSPFQILVFSENRMNCDLMHMGLLKSGIRS